MAEESKKVQGGYDRCPGCGARGGYRLGDGRRRCRRCGRKFTPHLHGNRLGEESLRRIALHFWLMVPAVRAARELGLERKTVQKYYRQLRQSIAEEGGWRGGGWVPVSSAGGAVRVFAVRFENGTLGVWPPLPGMDVCSVFAGGERDWREMDLASWRPAGESAERFWTFARPLLRRYRGRFRKALPLYLKEMGFRFNHRRDGWVVGRLTRLLRKENSAEPGRRRGEAPPGAPTPPVSVVAGVGIRPGRR